MSAVGVILGSGLGSFADTLENRKETPYSEIPGWPASTAIGHAGKLVTGRLCGTEVIVLAGRAHLYEGYTAQQVAYPIRELACRGVTSLVVTNAAGGVNLNYKPGDLVLISDHINLLGVNPLIGANDASLGPRFPDMSEAYSRDYREIAKQAGVALGLTLQEGVYAAVSGPSYETPAEIRFLRTIGADLVGMSTVPEVIAANHRGMKVLGISCVTNMAAGILPQKLTHQEVIDTGERVKDTLAALLRAVIPQLK
ncbi:MAG: inosine guanosine and xanthosine phosphorylase family [Bryobacterales bacterium]|nr:inosine guanosine and xanthosine phosphorylase family [Bryobacterales bacterium]